MSINRRTILGLLAASPLGFLFKWRSTSPEERTLPVEPKKHPGRCKIMGCHTLTLGYRGFEEPVSAGESIIQLITFSEKLEPRTFLYGTKSKECLYLSRSPAYSMEGGGRDQWEVETLPWEIETLETGKFKQGPIFGVWDQTLVKTRLKHIEPIDQDWIIMGGQL